MHAPTGLQKSVILSDSEESHTPQSELDMRVGTDILVRP